MTQSLKHVFNNIQTFEPFAPKVQAIYIEMDTQYGSVASQYGFHCQGCEDNCCLTQFFHHTLLELLYLYSGYVMLDTDIRFRITQKAHNAFDHYQNKLDKGAVIRIMCPLNFDSLCVLYDYRPMICRLHGIPYELRQPDLTVLHGPGCHIFDQQCAANSDVTFDRTPFYGAMAALENDIRLAFNFNQKLKLTIAEMILILSQSQG